MVLFVSVAFYNDFCATAEFQTISMQQRARAKRVHAKSDVWVEVFCLFLFSMIYYCKLVIAVVLMLVDDVAMCSVYSVCVEQDICMWKK